MLLSKKFITWTIVSIFLITLTNILAFYIFYTFYIKIYFYEKSEAKKSITLELINENIKKQQIDEIDSIFSDAAVEFFELLETSENWEILLDNEKNIDIVTNYLVKSWLTPKYIEEIIPTDNFEKVLESLSDKESPEAIFVNRFIYSVLITNLVVIVFMIILLAIFFKKTLSPINIATQKIKKLNKDISGNNSWEFEFIEYKNEKDEIWLLITSINALNSKLSLQNQIRTRLLADISHELKTPITSIQCYLEWISDWVIELNQKNLASITSEMNRLISLVNKIMDYENFDRKKMELNISEFDAVEALKNISETHKKKLKESNQRIKISWENFVSIKADKDLFFQLSHNLIWNFFKYAWENTQLNIIVTKKYIDFSDNWKWIKSSEIPFLTEKFYQWNIEKSGDADKRWIWVWLSIVAKIINSHSWKYEIKTDFEKWFSFKIFI